MVQIGLDCLLKNTDLLEKLKEVVPLLNLQVGSRNGRPTFRQVYKELISETGVEIDLDSFAKIYKSEIPAELKFTTDAQIEDILNSRTKQVIDKLINGTVDRIDGLGETSTDRAAIQKAARILTTMEGKDGGKKVKSMAKTVKDAVLASIQRLANNNENYKALKKRNEKETFEETLERVLEINSLQTEQMEADKFNTIQDVMEQARKSVLQSLEGITDEDGEAILGPEAEQFLEDYKNAFFGTMMSTADATTIMRGALLDAGYGKGTEGSQTVDWKRLAGEVNSPEVLRENVKAALMDGKGLTEEAADSITNALTGEFENLVQGQKAMDVKYAIAEAEAEDILERLGDKPTAERLEKINAALRDAIDNSVETEGTINISEIVHDVLQNVDGITQGQLANIPKKAIVTSHTADRIARLIGEEGDLDNEALAKLYGTFGKEVDMEVINKLRKLSKLKEDIEDIDIQVGADGKITESRRGIEKAKTIQTISDQMARIVANSIDYSGNVFNRFITNALNAFSKYLSANAALVLLNPFNLTQNIMSGAFAGTQGKIGGSVTQMFNKYKTPLIYKDADGKKVDLTSLLNTSGRFETWWNTLAGASGRDIPDLFTGDASRDVKTFQTAESKGEYIEATLTSLPRAALTATDTMLKEPYFRKELIRGVLYYLQAAKGKTKQESLDLVYQALTNNSPEKLATQAKQLATMVEKGNDKYYIKQIAEDIQLSSLTLLDADGRSILSEDTLQAIIDAATQTSSEVFGHRIQKDAIGFNWFFDLLTGAKAKAVEGLNKQYGDSMKELYSRGKYKEAAWLHFTHTLKTTVGFLFQRGIYNWAILVAQKNPLSIVRGFRALGRDTNFYEPKGSQEAVENYLRSRAKIGRGVLGTASALAIAPLVMSAIDDNCGDDEECKRKWIAALKKDPVWGRVYKNFVSPLAQTFIDTQLAETVGEGVGSGLGNILISPIVSAGARYYSVDNVLITAVENLKEGKLSTSGKNIGGVLTPFVPLKGFLSTNEMWWKRLTGKDSPGMVDKKGQIVIDKSKRPKDEDFWDSFWY